MKKSHLTNFVVRIENFFCVYRNYSHFRQSVKYIVSFRIFVETFAVLFTLVCYLYTFVGFASEFTNNCFMYFCSFNSLAAFYLSCYNSHHFNEFVFHIESVNKLYKNNAKYQSITKMAIRRFYIDIAIFVAFFTGMASNFVTAGIAILGDYFIMFELALIMILELRYYCENLIFYELIRLIVAPLEVINTFVEELVKKLKSERVEDNGELWEVSRELDKWGAASRHLASASDRLCNSFGVQIAFSIFSTGVFTILSLYECISSLVNQGSQTAGLDLGTIFYSLVSFIVIKTLIVISGQRVMSNEEQLKRNLFVLHNLLVGFPGAEAGACARAASDLARWLRAAPLRLRLLSALTVQMALLAELLVVVANYTIVLLQFNHVV